MTQQFTANEVRDIAWSLDGLSRQMLRAYADLLEAQEKAVPVYQHRSKNGSMLRWFDCSEETFMAMEHNEHDREHFDRRILYTHPSPSDTERLAEALRNLVSEWVAIADDGDATLEDSTIGYLACANRLSAMLAAHSTQAHPPAASVTDAMIMRAVKAWTSNGFGSPGQVFSIYSVAKVMLEAALAAQDNPR